METVIQPAIKGNFQSNNEYHREGERKRNIGEWQRREKEKGKERREE